LDGTGRSTVRLVLLLDAVGRSRVVRADGPDPAGRIANAGLTLPRVAGIRFTLSGQAMKTDFIEFYSADVPGEGSLGDLLIRIQSQTPLPRAHARVRFHNSDNDSELSAEYPLGRHL